MSIELRGGDPQLLSPPIYWRAEDAPLLRFEAAFEHVEPTLRVFWKSLDDANFTDEKSLPMQVVTDGGYRSYTIDLTQSSQCRGAMAQLRIDPVATGDGLAKVRMRSIELAAHD